MHKVVFRINVNNFNNFDFYVFSFLRACISDKCFIFLYCTFVLAYDLYLSCS